MQNETNISVEKINSLLDMLRNGSADTGKLSTMLKSALDDNQKSKLDSVLSDPQKLNGILSSPEAKAIMEKLKTIPRGENKNGPA